MRRFLFASMGIALAATSLTILSFPTAVLPNGDPMIHISAAASFVIGCGMVVSSALMRSL